LGKVKELVKDVTGEKSPDYGPREQAVDQPKGQSGRAGVTASERAPNKYGGCHQHPEQVDCDRAEMKYGLGYVGEHWNTKEVL
jgi:hypothetical protein